MAADFSGANLHLATFKKADLDGCILEQANFSGRISVRPRI
jgi:uncharacterized protein YjbI with pentapeptide repeats